VVVRFESSPPAHFFLVFRFDCIEGKIFPAMLGLELGKGKTILEVTSNLDKLERSHRATAIVLIPCSLLLV
jgi:hypothetical protein